MLGVPASVAGVRELVMAVSGAELHPAIAAAAELAGISKLVRLGGAQAIAAMAYGTETIPRVDKIVGPGQAYTQAAKRMLFGEVAIDAEAGPSEVLIVAEEGSRADFMAADLLAQAEHAQASVVLLTPSAGLAEAVITELESQLTKLSQPREIRETLRERSAAIVTRDLEEAINLANRYAAEVVRDAPGR